MTRTVKQRVTNESDDVNYKGRVTPSILCASSWRYQPRGNTRYGTELVILYNSKVTSMMYILCNCKATSLLPPAMASDKLA